MANKADEFIKELEAGDVFYYEMPPKERKKILELLTSPENKKKALDSLVAAATSKPITAREAAADLIDAIGDKDAIKRVAEFWMPFLDMEYGEKVVGGVPALDKFERFNRRQAVEIFERMKWPPAAVHEISIVKSGLGGKDFVEIGAIFTVIEKGRLEIKKYEDDFIEATKRAISSKDGNVNDYLTALFDMLKVSGTEKSRGLLKEYIDNNKNKTDEDSRNNVKHAREAVKEIEGRLGVPAKPAEEKIKKAMMEKKKVKV
jgi:hypothetical protein